MRNQNVTLGPAEGRENPPPNLGGYQLLVARAVWIVVVLPTVLIFIASVPVHFATLQEVCPAEPCVAGQLAPAGMRALGDLGISTGAYTAYVLALDLVVALGFCVVGAVVFWRRSQERGALLASFALVIFGLTWPDTFDSALYHPVWGSLAGFLTQLGLASLFVFFFTFPDGRFVPRWGLWACALVLVTPVLYVLFPDSLIVEPPMPWNILIFLGLWTLCAIAQVYRYRMVSGPVGRLQTKWVVFGMAVCVLLLVAFLLPVVFFPALERPGTVSLAADLAGLTVAGSFGFLLIPLSIGAAILRYRLYDIDIIINRALVYGSLTAVLVLAYLGIVVSSQYVIRTLTGQESQLAVVASTLAIAALFNPVRHRLQSFIDRRFYRQKYDAARTLEAYAADLREETDLQRLGATLVSVVEQTVQPEHVSLWLRPRDPGTRR